MFNFTKTNKSESLNDKLQKLENNFQEKMDEQDKSYKLHIQKLDEKIVVLEEKHKITYELMDKLYDYRFQEININTAKLSKQFSCKLNECISVYDKKLEFNFTTLQENAQNINSQINVLNKIQKETFIEIQKIKNNVGNNFGEQINTLSKQQEITNEKIIALNNNVSELDDKIDVCVCEVYEKINRFEEEIHDNIKTINNQIYGFEKDLLYGLEEKLDEKIKKIENTSNPIIDTSIITDKLEICMNAIKKINVYRIPDDLRNSERERYYEDNHNLGTSIIIINRKYEFSYINQFYNLKVLVLNNWSLFTYGKCSNNPTLYGPESDTFTKMRDKYGEMNNKTLETFIIHNSYDLKNAGHGETTRLEPLLLEYLCMQFKKFPSLKIVKLYYLDFPENIEDILIKNLKNMAHAIKELHIISNNDLKSSKLKNYCNNNNITFVVPRFNDFILSKDPNPQGKCFSTAFQWDLIVPLRNQLMIEDDTYMRRKKGYN